MNPRRRAAEDCLALLGRTRVLFLVYGRLPKTTHLLPAGGRRTRHPTPPIAAPGPVCAAALLPQACSHSGCTGHLPSRGQGLQLPHYSPGIVQNVARESQQLPVFPLTLSLSFRSLMCRTAYPMAIIRLVTLRMRLRTPPSCPPASSAPESRLPLCQGPRSDHESVVRLIILRPDHTQ